MEDAVAAAYRNTGGSELALDEGIGIELPSLGADTETAETSSVAGGSSAVDQRRTRPDNRSLLGSHVEGLAIASWRLWLAEANGTAGAVTPAEARHRRHT